MKYKWIWSYASKMSMDTQFKLWTQYQKGFKEAFATNIEGRKK